LCCSVDGCSPVHSSRVGTSSSFYISSHTPGGSGVRSDLLHSVQNRSFASETSPGRVSSVNSSSSPRSSQVSDTSTSSSSSPKLFDNASVIVLKQEVSSIAMESDIYRNSITVRVHIREGILVRERCKGETRFLLLQRTFIDYVKCPCSILA